MSCFSSNAVSYKLYYFNVRGRAEPTRLMFAAAGKEFEDIRFEQGKWPEFKPKSPQGMSPHLEFDGVQLPQSMAINRYIAEKFGMNGKTLWERTMIDVVCETIIDLRDKFIEAFFEKDEEKKGELMKTLLGETAPRFLNLLEDLLNQNQTGSGFFVGNSVSLADCFFHAFCETPLSANPNFLDKNEKLKANRQKVGNIEGIKKYLEKRPKTQF